MSDDQWLRAGLRDAVPEPPATPDRAAGARERARRSRRRTTVAVTLAAAVVVVAVAAAPALLSDDRRDPVTPPPTPTPTPSAVEVTCPAADEPAHGPRDVPDGAVAVRLCQGPGARFDAPGDLLVTDVPRVVASINRQQTGPAPTRCELDLGVGYQLVFGYPDGHTQNVAGELYGCHRLTVGGTFRSDPQKPLDTFVELLREQRATTDPPADAASPPRCDPGGSARTSLVARPREMVAATLCVTYHAVSEVKAQPAPVSARQLDVLLHDRVPGARPPYDVDRPSLLLVGETAWGDRTELSMDGGDGWVPGPDAARILNRLTWYTGRPIPTVDASSPAEDVVAAYVDLLNADDWNGAVALWDSPDESDLPRGFTSIDAKVAGTKQLVGDSQWDQLVDVTALYRERTDDASPPYHQVTFHLGRSHGAPFRILGTTDHGAVETGR